MARKRSPYRTASDDEAAASEPGRPRPRRRRRWRLRFALVILLAVALTAAAPTIIAKSPLRNFLLAEAMPSSAGQLTASAASFSWLSGQSLAGIALSDPAGQPLVAAESVTLVRSLVGLASNRRDLGKIVVVRPVVYLGTRASGSNVEDFVQRLVEALQDRADDESVAIAEIEIVDGVLLGRDETSGQQWRIDHMAATARPVENTEDWDITGEGALSLSSTLAPPPASRGVPAPGDPGAPAPADLTADNAGRFKFRLHPGVESRQQLELIADRIPLAPLEPWLARLLPGSRLTGAASADIKTAWSTPAPIDSDRQPTADSREPSYEILAAGKIDATAVRFTAPALDGDLVELPTASIVVDATLNGSRFSAAQLTVETDGVKAEFHGELDLADLQGWTLASLPQTDAELTAHVDLAQLTRMLPRTLRLRPGVQVDAGNIEITARSSTSKDNASRGVPAPAAAAAARTWTIAAAAQNLVGSDGTRPIRWSEPVEATFEATETPDGPQLVQAAVSAPFASCTAAAVDEGFQGKLDFNLADLASELGQFVDLSAWQLAGTGAGEFTLRHTGPDGFVATAGLDLRAIDVRRGGKVVWVDPQLRLELQTNGRRDGLMPSRIETATAFMRGPSDELSAELLEPIDLTSVQRQWFVKLTGHGPLESWSGRLRPWVAAVPEELAGQSTVSAKVRAGAGVIEVTESNLAVDELRAKIGASRIVEPRLEATGDFRWDARARAIDSRDLKLTSSTLAARARGLSLEWFDDGPPTVRGDVAFRGDFERLAAWLGLAGVDGGLLPRGQGVGRLKLASDAQRATADLTLTAEPLQLVRTAGAGVPEAIAWNEPRLEFATQATYTTADDRLELANLRVQGQTLQMTGVSVIEQFRTAGLVRGDMNVTYDAAELAKLVASYLGPDVQFQGANQARIQATGALYPPPSQAEASGAIAAAPISTLQPPASGLAPHWSRRWDIAAETGWSAATVYGLPIGAARVTTNIRDGQAAFSPLELTVGQGRISAQPRAILDPPPQAIHLPGGQLVSNVAISAEVSQRALKYAAPVVAGATRSEGSFSFFLEGAQIPLRQPKQGRASGRLTIHQLSVAPGPMIQDVARLVRQVEALSKSGQGLGLLDAVAPAQGDPLKGITMNEQTIDVQVVDGRVYHRNLEFMIDDVPVRSYGSVGFDETLALVITVPIQAKWVGSRPALQPLVGQMLEIPVSGTFTKWKIDERAIGNFLGQAAQAAAGGLLGDEVNKALDKLFKPR